MLISRTIAKRRIAAGTRPGFMAAWVPVLLDALVFVGVLALLRPLWTSFVTTAAPSMPVIAVALFAVVYLPMQAVLIVSSLWAAKSRWNDAD